jgi:hypothetical protein
MEKNKLSNLFAFISLVTGAIWFGAYISRLILTYNLFIEGELVLKNFINDTNIHGIFLAFEPMYYITFVTYLIFIVCFTLFLVFSKLKLKENGWLFIIAVIIYFTMPFEVILMVKDYNILLLYITGGLRTDLTLSLIIERLQMLGGFSVILILCYLSIPYFIVFRPFTSLRKDK